MPTPIIEIDLEEVTALDPLALCTPHNGDLPTLPTAATETSGIMTWTWTTGSEGAFDRVRIQIGEITRWFRCGPDRKEWSDRLDIIAFLRQVS